MFDGYTFSLDTDWKFGLIGRNGKGKTTFLRLLTGELSGQGTLNISVPVAYFPYAVTPEQMQKSAAEFSEELRETAQLWRVICELAELHEDAEILYRPFDTLSHGQRTKVLLAILFSGENDFLLIDEPTNHLDAQAREIVREYLSTKKGFILVSHDRDLLDACTDHILVLNRKTIMVQSGNFFCWQENQKRRDQFAEAENEKHRKEIRKLRQAAKRTAEWANKSERTKIRFDPVREHDRSISTRSYIGAKTKKMQSRVKNTERRIEREISEQEGLLQDIEEIKSLKLSPLKHHKETLVTVRDCTLQYSGAAEPVCTGLTFSVRQGQRIALHGTNGCGKSTLMRVILQKAGVLPPDDNLSVITGRILRQKENSTENVPFAHLSLHQVTVQELTGFLHTLQQINRTARLLFACTEERVEFYEKIKGVMEMLLGQDSLDEKSRDMYAESLKSLLMRAKDLLEEIPDEQSPSTVSTENKQLRMMLDEILNITETDSSSAKWIIHDLVQIDGDILVQPAPGISRTNHFGFLSDQDLCGNPDDLLPWPLDMRFFENVVLEDQSHTIFRIYRQSIISSLDFPKYTLIYGLLFSRDPVTLSYVKQVGCNDKGKDREPFYLFRLLGVKPHRIALENDCKPTDLSPYAYQSDTAETEYHGTLAEDSYPAQICTFRYVAERLVSRKTWYADRFSMLAYIKSCLMYLVLKSMVLYDGNQFLPESREALHTIVRNAASEVFGGEDFGKLCSLGFLTESELHEIRHDVTHQSQIRAYKIIKCICKKLYNSITAENPRQEFLLEPEAQILDNADVQSITQKDPDGSTVRILDRAAYFRKAVENYGKNTALYPNDSAYFEGKGEHQNPQQLWMTNGLYDRYAAFDVHKTRDSNNKERFSCSLCTCKTFCPHGLTSIT